MAHFMLKCVGMSEKQCGELCESCAFFRSLEGEQVVEFVVVSKVKEGEDEQ